MNEVSYGAPRPDAVRELSETMAAQQVAGVPATEELAHNFLARVQRDIDEQVDLRVQQQLATLKVSKKDAKKISDNELGLVLGSLGIAIPLTAAAGAFGGGIWGIMLVWVCLVIINVAWSQRS